MLGMELPTINALFTRQSIIESSKNSEPSPTDYHNNDDNNNNNNNNNDNYNKNMDANLRSGKDTLDTGIDDFYP